MRPIPADLLGTATEESPDGVWMRASRTMKTVIPSLVRIPWVAIPGKGRGTVGESNRLRGTRGRSGENRTSDGTNDSQFHDRSRPRWNSPDPARMLVKLVEAIRIVGTGIGFFLAYQSNTDPLSGEAIRILAGTMAFVMFGTCAFEGLFLARARPRREHSS